MIMDCLVSPSGKNIFSFEFCGFIASLMVISRQEAINLLLAKKWRCGNSDKEEMRMNLVIARHNHEVDKNNKYYAHIYDEAKAVWEQRYSQLSV